MGYDFKKYLDELSDFAYAEGFVELNLSYSGISTIYWHKFSINKPRRIFIEGKYTNEYKVYLMLHELGHHLLRRDWDVFGHLLPVTHHAESSSDSKYRRRQTYIVASLEEEFKAWDAGLRLAGDMNICVDIQKWHKFRAKCLMSYIKHYSVLKK